MQSIWYDLAGIARPSGHGMWYGLVNTARYMVWPVGYRMVWYGRNRMVYGMAWHGVWHGIWYGLAGLACYMVWPCGHGMVYGLAGEHVIVYGMARRAPYGVWNGLAGLTWYIIWPGGHRMVL